LIKYSVINEWPASCAVGLRDLRSVWGGFSHRNTERHYSRSFMNDTSTSVDMSEKDVQIKEL